MLYAAHRYGWGETNVGLTLAFVGICSAIVQGRLGGPVVACLGERRTLHLGLFFGAVGMTIYGLAPSGPGLFAGTFSLLLERLCRAPPSIWRR